MEQKNRTTDKTLFDAAIHRKRMIKKHERIIQAQKNALEKNNLQRCEIRAKLDWNEQCLKGLNNTSAAEYVDSLQEKRQRKQSLYLTFALPAMLAVAVGVTFFINPTVAWVLLMTALAATMFVFALRYLYSEPFEPFAWVTVMFVFMSTLMVPFFFGYLPALLITPSAIYELCLVFLLAANTVLMALVVGCRHVRYAYQKKVAFRESVLDEIKSEGAA